MSDVEIERIKCELKDDCEDIFLHIIVSNWRRWDQSQRLEILTALTHHPVIIQRLVRYISYLACSMNNNDILQGLFSINAIVVTDQLINYLKSEHLDTIVQAIDRLVFLNTQYIIIHMEQLMESEDEQIAVAAAATLGKLNIDLAYEKLIKHINDDDYFLQAMSMYGLAGIKHRYKNTIPILKDKLLSDNWVIREYAIITLSYIGGDEAFKAIIQVIHDYDNDVRMTAMMSLRLFHNTEVIDVWISRFEIETNSDLREVIIHSLMMTNDSKAKEYVYDLLQHGIDPNNRQLVAMVLGDYPTVESFSALVLALDDDDKMVRYHAADSISEMHISIDETVEKKMRQIRNQID